MPNKYFYLSRPPSYAHQPPGFSNRDGGLPSRNWPTAQGGQCWCFGFVEYPNRLPPDEICGWGLLPDNPVELASYQFWNFANRDALEADYLAADYVAAYQNGTLSENDRMYEWAKILAEEKR